MYIYTYKGLLCCKTLKSEDLLKMNSVLVMFFVWYFAVRGIIQINQTNIESKAKTKIILMPLPSKYNYKFINFL